MRYLFGCLLPALLQVLIVFIIIQANTGNGSWLGLAALLIGIFAVPGTAILNFFYVHAHKQEPTLKVIGRCFLIACIAPIAITLMLFIL